MKRDTALGVPLLGDESTPPVPEEDQETDDEDESEGTDDDACDDT